MQTHFSTEVSQPDWPSASFELIRQLQQLAEPESRVELLEALCQRLGANTYPAFLQMLFYIEHHTDAEVQKLLTDTLAYAIGTGRLPSGPLPAWGSTNSLTSNPYKLPRTLGPIEFICAWYAQPTNLPDLNTSTFQDALSTLLRLFDSNRKARKLYCYNLNMDSIEGSIGMFSNSTRLAISKLAKNWNIQGHSNNLAKQFIDDIAYNQHSGQLSNFSGFSR